MGATIRRVLRYTTSYWFRLILRRAIRRGLRGTGPLIAAALAIAYAPGCSPTSSASSSPSSFDLSKLAVELPRLQDRPQTSTIPDFGPEVQLAGTFEGTLDEIVEFVGAQGVILGLADIPDQDGDDDQARRYRVRWGAGLDATTALQVLAMQLGEGVLALRRGPDMYVLGKPSDRDLEGRVLYVTEELAEQYVQAIRAMLGDSARVAAVGDVLVVRDTPAGMRVVEELYEALNAARGQWVVEVRFVELSDTAAQALGMDLEAAGQLSLALSGSLSSLSLTDIITARLDGLIAADAAEEHVRTLTTTRLHVIEGETAELQVGSTVPVPLSVSENLETGLISRDFEDVDTGVLLNVTVRTEPDGRLRVYMQPEISEITGFVEDRPIRSRRRVKTAGVLEPGGSLIAGGFFQDKSRASKNGLPQLLDSRLAARHDAENNRSRIYVVLRLLNPSAQPPRAQAARAASMQPGRPADILDRDTSDLHHEVVKLYAPK